MYNLCDLHDRYDLYDACDRYDQYDLYDLFNPHDLDHDLSDLCNVCGSFKDRESKTCKSDSSSGVKCMIQGQHNSTDKSYEWICACHERI